MAKKQDITIKKRSSAAAQAPEEPAAAPDDIPALEALPPKKRRRRRSTVLRILLRLLIVAALLLTGLWVYKNWDSIAPESLLLWMDEKFGGGEKGDGFPVELTGSEIITMLPAKNNMALLSDTNLLLYNSRGGQVASRPHGYARPIMKTAGEYILIAETGGTRFRLENRATTLLDVPANNQKTEDGKTFDVLDIPLTNSIVAAAVDEKGNVALITGASQSHTSEVVVYNKRGKRLYARQSAELITVAAAFAPDGKHLAVAGMNAAEGALKSSVQIFDMTSTSSAPVKEYSDTDVMLCELAYFPGGTVVAVGDTATWVMNPEGTLFEKHRYEDDELIGFVVGSDAAGIVLRRYGNTDGGRLMVINPTGDQAYSADFDGAFRHIATAKSGFWLLTGNTLRRAGLKGFDASLPVPSDGRLVGSLGDKALVMGLTSLNEYTP